MENTHPNLPTVRGNEVTVLDIIIIADSYILFIFVSYNHDCGYVTCISIDIHSESEALRPSLIKLISLASLDVMTSGPMFESCSKICRKLQSSFQ